MALGPPLALYIDEFVQVCSLALLALHSRLLVGISIHFKPQQRAQVLNKHRSSTTNSAQRRSVAYVLPVVED